MSTILVEPKRQTLTLKKVAEQLGVDSYKVLLWIKRGELQAINVALNQQPGRRPRYRVPLKALDEFLAKRSTIPPAPAPRRRQRSEKATQEVEYIR
jgi:excisionase family DNA binding protein